MMEAEQLDLLIAYADDPAVFGPAHARWLANFPVHFEPVCVVLARSGQALLLCGPESDGSALLAGRIRDVYIFREFTHPDEDYPFSQIRSLAEVAAMLVSGPSSLRRVGVAGRGLMGYDFLCCAPGGAAGRGVGGCRDSYVQPARQEVAGSGWP